MIFGDKLYAFIHLDELQYHFHLALGGAISFSDSCSSILSKYETVGAYAPRGSKSQLRIVAPPLSANITPLTKIELKQSVATRVSNTAPKARLKERLIKRQERTYIKITSIVDTRDDSLYRGERDVGDRDDGILQRDYAIALAKDVGLMSKRQEFLMIYYGMICMVYNRSCGKSDSMLGSKGEPKGKTMPLEPGLDCEKRKLKRTQGLFEMSRILDSVEVYYRPSMIQFSNSFTKKNPKSLAVIYQNKDPKLTGLSELLVYWRVGGVNETVSTSSVELEEFFIPCQSGKGDGSITIKSYIKGCVLYDFFVDQVLSAC